MERVPAVSGTTNLIDILDRVLDKGLVIAGDIRISLANVELLTIRIGCWSVPWIRPSKLA